MKERLSSHDVSGRIDVCAPDDVRHEVERLVSMVHPDADLGLLQNAFSDFVRLFEGKYPGYHACDTRYHDLQHTLDVTLAMARLLHGHERAVESRDRLGARRVVTGLIAALFHDAGYVRAKKDTRHRSGAAYTHCHVSRSARFLTGWLLRHGWPREAEIAAKVVHFTGYEIALGQIRLRDPQDWLLGCMLGTADLIAQMSGRNYLERCRDYLYEEFVTAGIAVQENPDGSRRVLYESAEDLLRKTPTFYESEVQRRLDEDFRGVFRYASMCFEGRNLYIQELEKNIAYLRNVIALDDFTLLRRSPSHD